MVQGVGLEFRGLGLQGFRGSGLADMALHITVGKCSAKVIFSSLRPPHYLT